jgi:uncharacterized short protein YbdD (DUF466 family)
MARVKPSRRQEHRGAIVPVRSFLSVLRTIVGVPDYDRYLRHMARRHPECAPLTRNAFVQARQEARYSRVGGRCC